MGKYKYLHRFQIINCAECESTNDLTVNEYTEEVLCLTCLMGLSENEKQTECFDCGDIFPIDEMRYARSEPVLICENCSEERLKEDE